MQPRGSTRPSVSKSSCTIGHHPTENGEAEPQSMERKRIHSLGTSNGLMTCRPLSQQSKNAPKVTDQSPSSYADTALCCRKPVIAVCTPQRRCERYCGPWMG